MNAAELNDGAMHLSQEFLYMFPISAGIIVISFLLAFSHVFANDLTKLVLSAVSFVANTALTWVSVRSGAYMLGRDMGLAAARLRDREEKITGMWKAEVRRKKTNIEKLKASVAMRSMVKGRDGGPATMIGGKGERDPRVFSPYIVSPQPGISKRMGSDDTSGTVDSKNKGLGVREYDVELGSWRDDASRVELYSQYPGRAI
jgi:hypothetical protein